MSGGLLFASFDREEDVLAATAASREHGCAIVDVFTPYAVHGLDEAMGLPPSRLPWACFIGGATGLALGVSFQVWTSAFDWPIDVGGKPFISLPAFIPVAFECTILLAGLATFFATFARCRLYPGARPALPVERATDDRFTIVIDMRGDGVGPHDPRALLERFHPVEIREAGPAPLARVPEEVHR